LEFGIYDEVSELEFIFYEELIPAFRFNLFIFKEKIKRIFTSIRARN